MMKTSDISYNFHSFFIFLLNKFQLFYFKLSVSSLKFKQKTGIVLEMIFGYKLRISIFEFFEKIDYFFLADKNRALGATRHIFFRVLWANICKKWINRTPGVPSRTISEKTVGLQRYYSYFKFIWNKERFLAYLNDEGLYFGYREFFQFKTVLLEQICYPTVHLKICNRSARKFK